MQVSVRWFLLPATRNGRQPHRADRWIPATPQCSPSGRNLWVRWPGDIRSLKYGFCTTKPITVGESRQLPVVVSAATRRKTSTTTACLITLIMRKWEPSARTAVHQANPDASVAFAVAFDDFDKISCPPVIPARARPPRISIISFCRNCLDISPTTRAPTANRTRIISLLRTMIFTAAFGNDNAPFRALVDGKAFKPKPRRFGSA